MYSKNIRISNESQKFDFKLLKRLLKYTSPYKYQIILAIFLVIFTTALLPLRPYLTKIAIDTHIANNNFSGLTLFASLIFILILLTSFLQFIFNYIMQWLGQKTLQNIRVSLFSHITKLPVRYFDKNPVGRVVTRVTNDVEALNELFSSGVVMVFADILMILWIIAFMFYTNSELTLLSFAIIPLLALSSFFFRNKIRRIFRELRKNLAEINTFINEFISGISTIKIFSALDLKNREFKRINENQMNLQKKTILYYSLFFPTIEIISALGLGLILWYSAGSISTGDITVGVLIAFTQYIEMLFRPIRDITEKYTTLQSALAASERIFEVLDENTEETINLKFNGKQLRGDILFENVSFAYDGINFVLKHLSFKIEAGEKIAIVGTTGSGKSTIVNLICGLYKANSGKIFIDGYDINSLDKNTLRRNIAFVPQDFFLFSRSIAENILFDDYNNNELLEYAAKLIGSDRFIKQFPNKYYEILPEKGLNLSTGQRQLIALTRAFASNRNILIFDEATSNIDPQSEKLINQSINLLMDGRTTIIISHRFSTIEKADRIIVVNNGIISATGTHKTLMKENIIYRKLYELNKI